MSVTTFVMMSLPVGMGNRRFTRYQAKKKVRFYPLQVLLLFIVCLPLLYASDTLCSDALLHIGESAKVFIMGINLDPNICVQGIQTSFFQNTIGRVFV